MAAWVLTEQRTENRTHAAGAATNLPESRSLWEIGTNLADVRITEVVRTEICGVVMCRPIRKCWSLPEKKADTTPLQFASQMVFLYFHLKRGEALYACF